jgi:hypothetical protein
MNTVKQPVKHPPYNTGKVVIGSLYTTRQLWSLSDEEIFWQAILTSKPLSESVHAKDVRLACVIVICMVALLVWAVL